MAKKNTQPGTIYQKKITGKPQSEWPYYVKWPNLKREISKDGEVRPYIYHSVQDYYRAQGISGKGAEGQQWAGRLLTALRQEMHTGQPVATGKATVRDLLDNYRQDRADAGKELSHHVITHITRLCEFFRDTLARDVSTDMLRSCRMTLKQKFAVSDATVCRHFAVLRCAYGLGRATTPPLFVGDVPKFPKLKNNGRATPRQAHLRDLDEWSQLSAALDPDFERPFFTAAAYYGLRSNTIKETRWEWIEWLPESGRAVKALIHYPGEYNGKRIVKNGESHVVPVYGELYDMLRRQQQQLIDFGRPDFPYVFFNKSKKTGAVYKPGPVLYLKRWHRAIRRLGWDKLDDARLRDLHPHDLRRTTLLLAKRYGLTKEECKAMMGHKTDAMFIWYGIKYSADDAINIGEKINRGMEREASGKVTSIDQAPQKAQIEIRKKKVKVPA